MSGAWHGGKGDRIPGANDAAYRENYPAIDWNAREREAVQKAYGPTARVVQTTSGPVIAVKWVSGANDFGVIAVDQSPEGQTP